jgi:hypothetical protein
LGHACLDGNPKGNGIRHNTIFRAMPEPLHHAQDRPDGRTVGKCDLHVNFRTRIAVITLPLTSNVVTYDFAQVTTYCEQSSAQVL